MAHEKMTLEDVVDDLYDIESDLKDSEQYIRDTITFNQPILNNIIEARRLINNVIQELKAELDD